MEARVYVGTYGKYNEGSIAGAWLDISNYADKSEFYDACRELHSDEDEPEYMFQDWEGIPEGMIEESWIDEQLFEFADLDDDDMALLIDFKANVDKDGSLEDAKERVACRVEDFEEYADEQADEMLWNVPDQVKYYFDYVAWRRDLSFDYYFGSEFVFRNC